MSNIHEFKHTYKTPPFPLGMGHSLITTIGRKVSSTRLPHAAALATAITVAAVKQLQKVTTPRWKDNVPEFDRPSSV
jgi:hypothetical protein